MKGGKQPGAGRPKGMRNKKTMEQLRAVKASGLTPLEYLLKVMRNTKKEEHVRIDAAKAAAPYVHPKLSQIDMSATIEDITDPKELTNEELHRAVKTALKRI